jgi:hypothetical protein
MLDSGMTNRSVGVSAELRVAAKQVPHRLAYPSCFSPKLRIRCLLVHASVVLAVDQTLATRPDSVFGVDASLGHRVTGCKQI